MSKKTLVIGASEKRNRYSNLAIHKLLKNNHEVIAIGTRNAKVNGVLISTELQHYKNIDTVTLYVSAKHQKEYYDYIISLNPKRVIFNPGSENPEFYKILKENNIHFEVACTLTLLVTNQY
ncbi:MAG TPA: CoA-binding protein [Flavobacteriaceae bacterium]|nr:CoA-binding protein [Flavobacteriaceae bacterium]